MGDIGELSEGGSESMAKRRHEYMLGLIAYYERRQVIREINDVLEDNYAFGD